MEYSYTGACNWIVQKHFRIRKVNLCRTKREQMLNSTGMRALVKDIIFLFKFLLE